MTMKFPDKLEILVVDDHDLVRAGIVASVHKLAESTSVFEATTIAEAIKTLQANPLIDLILLDLVVPDACGFDGLDRILLEYPDIPVILLTADVKRETIDSAFAKGVTGYIPKSSNMRIIVNALQIILAGGRYLPGEMLASRQENIPELPVPPLPAPTAQDSGTDLSRGMTDRQVAVANLLRKGLSNKEICRELDLSVSTVKTHVAAVLRACRTTSRAKAIAVLNASGW